MNAELDAVLNDEAEENDNDLFCMLTHNIEEELEPAGFKEALANPAWKESMLLEIQKLTCKGTFDLVDRPKQRKVMKSVWAYKIKRDFEDNVKERKSRLNAAGYAQIPGQDFDKTFASVGKKYSLRIMFRIIAAFKLKFALLDFESAFLNGQIDVLTFMEQPRGLTDGTDKVWKLNKSIYGLRQSAFIWKATLTGILSRLDYVSTTMDDCLFFGTKKDLPRLLFTHVDDLLAASREDSHLDNLHRELQKEFSCKMEKTPKVVLGIEIRATHQGLHLTQSGYVARLVKKYRRVVRQDMTKLQCPKGFTFQPLGTTEEEIGDSDQLKSWFHAAVGAILHAAVNVRPDLAYYASFLGKYVSNPTERMARMLDSLIDYIEDTVSVGLDYQYCSNQVDVLDSLTLFTDADFATDPAGRKSRTGIVVMLLGGIIAWSSKKQPIAVLGYLKLN
eukprot:TRINITY_DN2159_c0_g1_i1.p1 TRINITY_DN2159_c0_g1~~TRINITY_DN2159_c0_g1_i1.p1  ORF type:complete len:524 (+),score=87.53 TRINITY_DN2159_c0_g1_i1:236-1573(+)